MIAFLVASLPAQAPQPPTMPGLVVILGNTLKASVALNFPLKVGVLASKTDIADEIWETIQCESGWNNSAVGKKGEIGVAQFLPSTWSWMSKLANFNGDIYNGQDQLWLMEWAWNNPPLQEHWSCYKKVGK